METADVIVVGAGPTGLFVAADLAEAGIDVVVLDRRGPEQSNLTRAFVVGPRTLEQFDARGIADELVATGSRLTSMRLYRRLWIDFAPIPTRFPYQLITPQYETEAVLRARAVGTGVRFAWRTEVTGLSQNDARVRVTTASGQQWQASYLVGADGSRSTVREAVGEPFPGRVAVRSMMLADVRFTDPPDAVLRSDANRSGFAFHVPFGDGWHRVIAWNRADDRPPGAPLDPDDVSTMLRRVFGTDYGLHETRWLSRFRADERQVARYRIGRVFLAGDAAHVHTPAGAQGMNTGLQDAANLGWRLAAGLRGHAGPEVLDGYQRERHPVAARVIRGSGALMRAALTASPRLRALRLARLGGLSGRWPAPKPVAAAVAGTGIRYPAPPGAHPAVGRRVPDLPLTGRGRLYAALRGGRFVLVRSGRQAGRHPWHGPVTEVVSALPLKADLLVRPDGHLAWADPA
ncbi:FAD-dependent oxidoreductase [Streptomyces sp. MP131-18]|uniref:FAD-dependent oxidoreductase n=1 Tax=Streptomyces sp. MP131-18 TaxID=1857892 RepID=UPI00097C4C37|nr:FAD-dependent oxidoreductase [Streptomyces sp. MP131-18]ONK13350.1 Pentachlorophenol 4-monooxygenase [Streptomyces sp. MP131-18]